MERTISKHMEPPWEPKWRYHLPIFSCLKLKQHWYKKAKPSQKNGDDILTISSPSRTVMKKTWINLLNKLTNSTLSSENEITFLNRVVFNGERLKKESILDIKTHDVEQELPLCAISTWWCENDQMHLCSHSLLWCWSLWRYNSVTRLVHLGRVPPGQQMQYLSAC